MNNLDWFAYVLHVQKEQVKQYFDTNQIDANIYDAAIVIIEKLEMLVEHRKQNTFWYKLRNMLK